MATAPDRPRPARRDGRCVRGDGAAEARAEPDHRHAGRSRLLARVRVRARRRGHLVRPAASRDRDGRHPRPRRAIDSDARPQPAASPQAASRTRGTVATTSTASCRRASTVRACGCERNGRTIVLPNPIRVDTTAPVITLVRAFPRVFSPDGDGRRDRVTATYRIDERARAVMLVDGRQRVQSKFRRLQGKLVWFGRVNGRTVRARPVRDPAARRRSSGQSLDADARRARPGAVRRALAGADRGRRRQALLGSASSPTPSRTAGSSPGSAASAGAQVLVLRAPETPGTYSLYVTVGGRAARAAVDVVPPAAE